MENVCRLHRSQQALPQRSSRPPENNQVIDSTSGCTLLSFLDCYLGYHQIAIKDEDQIKTAFITAYGAYCYKTMSFRLKNAGATYQRAIQLCFSSHLHQYVEAYVDERPRRLHQRSRRNLQQPKKISVEAKPNKMFFWRAFRKTTRIHHQ